MDETDAILLALSAPSISAKTLRTIETAALEASPRPARIVRLEEEGPSLFDALDALCKEGARSIRVQPIGFPFPENLKAWIPGALASWGDNPANRDIHLTFGMDNNQSPDLIRHFVERTLAQEGDVAEIGSVAPSLGKRAWDMPPDFDFHLLVCVGPRCQVHGATPFLQMLQTEVRKAGLQKRCLITRTSCIYPCNKGPVLVLYPHGDWYRLPDEQSIKRFVSEALLGGTPLPEFIFHHARLAQVTQGPASEICQSDDLHQHASPISSQNHGV
ncbi:(2Fe-2S) ferredoxin domain-containing protein [uncultured Cohaesibacter sp.]|uniref:(2Fe-2S) ferredoxin domain-containing protein n=1 Tax=uncultured Cohaesibacter sp. TaxID=1002546 RepID=UPI00292FEA9E|nr:(2Fe-2S) ferredoxin domain-containing protein [uncultured Cohaesibacter sp.]